MFHASLWLFQMHLFDIDIPRKITFQESKTLSPGNAFESFSTREYSPPSNASTREYSHLATPSNSSRVRTHQWHLSPEPTDRN